MSEKSLSYFDILEAKKAYREGKNITELLRSQKNRATNTSEIIETAYDLQAGTYIKSVENNSKQAIEYTTEIASLLNSHIDPSGSLLDIGTGELTTLSLITKALTKKPKKIYAFDISWSRLFMGMTFAKKNMGSDFKKLTPFVGDIGEIPLLDKSIHITTSSHALEPNGGRLKELLAELFRVTLDKLVLFEPCFEINSEEGKQRMERLGYIKNVDKAVEALGGQLTEKIMIKNISNPLNPTVCFVITPPASNDQASNRNSERENIFSVPGTNYPLKKVDDFYFSHDTGLCYPMLKSIPILKSKSSILASVLGE